jgi:hypothetical protein
MAYLGLSSGPTVTSGGQFGNALGSMQCPPFELRITASHPLAGKIVMLEFPMLMDPNYNALELGNPRKSVLSLSHLDECQAIKCPTGATDYEASRLVAKASSKYISITWRKHGTLSFLPSAWLPEDTNPSVAESLFSERRRFKDESLVPVPLELPKVPLSNVLQDGESVSNLMWWLDENFGGPPLLVALTTAGSIIIFELPPPWSSQDPVNLRTEESQSESASCSEAPDSPRGPVELDPTYQVLITPDAQFGLGLRLEVQTDGSPAIAGSFKRHPTTGEALPAEKTGMITLGDELIAANDIVVDNKSFDDIIATVRDLGASCTPGNPMRLTFRRKSVPRVPRAGHLRVPTPYRTMEDIIGLKTNGSDRSASRAGASETQEAVHRLPSYEAHIVGHFKEVVPKSDSVEAPLHGSLVSCSTGHDSEGAEKSSLIFCSCGKKISVVLVAIVSSRSPAIFDLGSWTKPDDGKDAELLPASMAVIHSFENRYYVLTSDTLGTVHLLVVEVDTGNPIDPKLSFRHHEIFRLPQSPSAGLVLRTCGIELLGSMERGENDLGSEINVWSVRPNPGCSLVQSTAESEDFSEYSSFAITADSISSDDGFVEFDFIHSGFLDASPCLAAFLGKQVVIFRKDGGSDFWIPAIQISYLLLPGSLPSSKPLSVGHRDPHNYFPHILSASQMLYSSCDEKEYLSADWHPESVLAHLFTDKRGVQVSLNDQVRYLLIWLSSEGRELPDDYLDSPLVVAPLPILEEKRADNNEDREDAPLGAKLASSGETLALQKLQKALAHCCSLKRPTETTVLEAEDGEAGLPLVLKSTIAEDLSILRGICDLLLEPPDFKSLDDCGQHFILSLSLLYKLRPPEQTDENSVSATRATGFSIPKGLQQSTPSTPNKSNKDKPRTQVAASACFAALLSNHQSVIIARCKQLQSPLNWESARELRLPFWVRSDQALARLSEEIGQSIFREKRDIMDCALFFIIARKMRTLKNLAATDPTEKGRTFFKFITSFDFSTERGRRAAEKNAFSLLRKCQYRVAAAFFLLGQPPALTSAIETLATKLHDPDLAFLVARLMESKELAAADNSTGATGVGALGGGGGYAGSGITQEIPVLGKEVSFDSWSPKLGVKGRALLVGRTLPKCVDNSALTAVQLLWLGKSEEAAWSLTGIIRVEYGKEAIYSVVNDASYGVFSKTKDFSASEKTNALIDFMSAPNLLTEMRASHRVRFAATFNVARALSGKGLELPSINASIHELVEMENGLKLNRGDNRQASEEVIAASTHSSLFDSFNGPTKPTQQTPSSASVQMNGTATPGMQSSIFDSFDAPKQPPQPVAASEAESSIFDSFDVPTQMPKASPKPTPPASGGMQSSIFDSFDVPPPKTKVTPTPASGGMQSSIFDSFDVPPPKRSLPSSIHLILLPNAIQNQLLLFSTRLMHLHSQSNLHQRVRRNHRIHRQETQISRKRVCPMFL